MFPVTEAARGSPGVNWLERKCSRNISKYCNGLWDSVRSINFTSIWETTRCPAVCSHSTRTKHSVQCNITFALSSSPFMLAFQCVRPRLRHKYSYKLLKVPIYSRMSKCLIFVLEILRGPCHCIKKRITMCGTLKTASGNIVKCWQLAWRHS
jgi:hypothetical protein